MVLRLTIHDFSRIRSASVTLDDLVIFVGNNNSGKTLAMQLIYGIRKALEDLPVPTTGIKRSDLNGQYLIRCDRDWFKEVELQINKYLTEHRAQILEDIFGICIPVEEIKISLVDTASTYFVSSVSIYQNTDVREPATRISIDTRQYENGENINSFETQIPYRDHLDPTAETLKIIWKIILSGKAIPGSGQLFLPASRAGLQLLYKHYFAAKIEQNMASPVKDFLLFLQLYSEDKHLRGARKALLEFAEEHLLQGRLLQKDNETLYVDRYTAAPIPLFVASSMIHELAPLIKALTSTQQIDWLYCDEVENSLHPLLQKEMARWLIRMVNAGIHVIISSHSDTMASRLNNLLMLTYLYQKKTDRKISSGPGLTEADLLRPEMKASIYEFQDNGSGQTVVEKLEFMSHPLIGYDFQLFNKNLDELYDEAEQITR